MSAGDIIRKSVLWLSVQGTMLCPMQSGRASPCNAWNLKNGSQMEVKGRREACAGLQHVWARRQHAICLPSLVRGDVRTHKHACTRSHSLTRTLGFPPSET